MTDTEARDRDAGGQKGRGGLGHVRIIVPVVVGLGLLAYVISIAVAPKSGDQLWQLFRATWWVALILTVPYLALRAVVWHTLLRQLGIRVPWRPMLVSFAGGEITKSLPGGIYVQNYLLARLEHFGQERIARATMASTAMLGLEAAIAFPICIILGWPNDSSVRWVLVGVAVAWVVGLALAWLLVRFGIHHLPRRAPEWIRTVTRFIEQFLDAGGELVSWQTARSLPPTAAYMLVYVVDLDVIVRALGLHVGLLAAVAIYAFTVLSVILIPIPTEIGLTEFTGLAALTAYGIPGSEAAVVILGLRALATGMTIVVSGVLLVILRGQFSRMTSDAPADGQGARAAASTAGANTAQVEEPQS